MIVGLQCGVFHFAFESLPGSVTRYLLEARDVWDPPRCEKNGAPAGSKRTDVKLMGEKQDHVEIIYSVHSFLQPELPPGPGHGDLN